MPNSYFEVGAPVFAMLTVAVIFCGWLVWVCAAENIEKRIIAGSKARHDALVILELTV